MLSDLIINSSAFSYVKFSNLFLSLGLNSLRLFWEILGEFLFQKFTKRMIKSHLHQFKAAVSVDFSFAQIDPLVEPHDDAAVTAHFGLEVVHQKPFVVAQGADEFFIGSSLLLMARGTIW